MTALLRLEAEWIVSLFLILYYYYYELKKIHCHPVYSQRHLVFNPRVKHIYPFTMIDFITLHAEYMHPIIKISKIQQ